MQNKLSKLAKKILKKVTKSAFLKRNTLLEFREWVRDDHLNDKKRNKRAKKFGRTKKKH